LSKEFPFASRIENHGYPELLALSLHLADDARAEAFVPDTHTDAVSTWPFL
jgi:hypothetical protein